MWTITSDFGVEVSAKMKIVSVCLDNEINIQSPKSR